MESSKAVAVCAFRFILPAALVAAIICRQNVMTLLYLGLLLAAPLVPSPSQSTLARHTRNFLRVTLTVSIAAAVAQITFQVTLLSMPPYGFFIGDCSNGTNVSNSMESILRHIGFQRYDNINAKDAARLIAPEVLMVAASVIVYILCSKVSPRKTKPPQQNTGNDHDTEGALVDTSSPEDVTALSSGATPSGRGSRYAGRVSGILAYLGDGITLTLLAAAGIMRPSVTSALYFVTFLFAATWVASCRKLRRKFAVVRLLCLAYSGLHLLAIYLYQMEFFQNLIPAKGLYARLFGLSAMVVIRCEEPRHAEYQDLEWAAYVNPAIILALYWVLALQTRIWLSSPNSQDAHKSLVAMATNARAVMSGPMATSSPTKSDVSRLLGHPHQQQIQRNQHRLSRARSERGPPRRQKTTRRKTASSCSNKRLLSSDGLSRRYNSLDASGNERIEIDPNGSVILSGHDVDVDTRPDGASEPEVSVRRAPLAYFKNVLSPLTSVMMLVMRSSYAATLIVMMTWSITYVSWLTFVLLLWSCVLWMMPSSRRACLKSSPALVAYALALLVLQYIYGMDLTEDELPTQPKDKDGNNSTTFDLADIGLVKYGYLPCLPLAVKILFTVMFWITLRQHMEESAAKKNRELSCIEGVMMEPLNGGVTEAERPSFHSSPVMKDLGSAVLRILTKYWIWMVACMLVVTSMEGERVVLFRITYMALFLFFILMFQMSYRVWRATMYAFWLTVIIYSMVVLILIYTYQFRNFPEYWQKYIGISTNLQRDIGLEVYGTAQLFLKLLPPTFFVIITIIQLHYFHKDFLINTDIDRKYSVRPTSETAEGADNAAAETEKEHVSRRPIVVEIQATPLKSAPDDSDKDPHAEECQDTDSKKDQGYTRETLQKYLKKLWGHLTVAYEKGSELAWRFLEIHIAKVVLFSALMLAVYDVCAVHFVFVLLVTLAVPLRPLQTVAAHCCSIWACVLLISKMIYQIDYIQEVWKVNCTMEELVCSPNNTASNATNCTEIETFFTEPPFDQPINNAHWMGFHKSMSLANYLKGYIGLIVVLTVRAVVQVRQRYHRNRTMEPEPKPGVIFSDITRANADDGIIECIKYLANYAFYKFGVEVCFMTTVAVIGVRLDLYAVLYSLWLMAMFLLRRKTLARIWPFYVAFLCVLLPLQYSFCVGIPPGACIQYLWNERGDSRMDPELREWLFLPDFSKPLAAYKLAVDFFLLLFASCQLWVFALEANEDNEAYEGGSNRDIVYDARKNEINPIPDFVTYTKSYLDLVKNVVLSAFYWITLAVVFLAGTNRVSLFAMGYVIGCFMFLWNGQEFYLKPIKTILRLWNTFLAYNVFVIFTKTILQMIGCVHLEKLQTHFCWTVQLFGIACLKKFEKGHVAPGSLSGPCRVPEDEAGLLWDGICLAFLLLQRRLFCSHYFHHLVVEMQAQTTLASRGAELINGQLLKEVREQQAAEKEIVEKIKKKMDRIRANQQKIRGREFTAPDDHFEDEEGVVLRHRPRSSWKEWDYPEINKESEYTSGRMLDKNNAQQAIRSGDYYMFEGYSDDDGLVDLDYGPDKKTDEVDDAVKGLTVTQLMSSAMRSDIKQAVTDARLARESTTSTDFSGRPPVSRTVSAVSGASSLPVGMSVSRQASLRSQLASMPQMGDSLEDPSSSAPGGYGSRLEPGPGAPTGYSPESPGAPAVPPRAEPDSSLKETAQEEDTKPKESVMRKIINWVKFGCVFLEGVMNSLTIQLNSVSRDYRYVAECLAVEKRALKEKKVGFQPWAVKSSTPDVTMLPVPMSEEDIDATFVGGPEGGPKSDPETSGSISGDPATEKKQFEKEQPAWVRLVVASWYALVSRSEIVCYVMIIVNQVKSASILSLPLPFMAFLWGTLSVPRPSKTFWITVITYTEAVVVLKYLFQFGFFEWNKDPVTPQGPFWLPRIFGIEKKEQYAVYDLALLLVVFFHRFILKTLGLWKDGSPLPEELDDGATSLEDLADNKDTKEKKRSSEESHGESQLEVVAPEEAMDYDEEVEEDIEEEPPNVLVQCFWHYADPFRQFARSLLHPSYRVAVDVYAYMFLCDFITFLILVFGYWAFGTGVGDVASYFEENKVPVPFLVMLIAQFGLIIIDRALFLRKFIMGKVIFQVAMVFIVHFWMFFVLPAVSEKGFNQSLPPQLWYFVKCVYLLLSAYQIRSGYPTRILGNFVTKKYNYLNMFLFRGFMLVPFLFELRALMDWIWTDTSMSLSSWLKMEDVFANIFILKCQRRAEVEYPTPRGERRNPIIKYIVGGFLLFIIIFIIWFPLVLFALGNTVGTTSLPYDCTVELSFGGYQPLFRMSAQHSYLKALSDSDFAKLSYEYRESRDAGLFLHNYEASDVAQVEISGDSAGLWGISPPSRARLAKDLRSDKHMTLRFAWSVSRMTSSKVDVASSDERILQLDKDHPLRKQMADFLSPLPNTVPASNSVEIPNIMPRFLRLPASGNPAPVRQLGSSKSQSPMQEDVLFADLSLTLRRSNITLDDLAVGSLSVVNLTMRNLTVGNSSMGNMAFGNLTTSNMTIGDLTLGNLTTGDLSSEWWELHKKCTKSELETQSFPPCNKMNILIFSDKMFPSTISFLSGQGILGLYTTLVLVASRFVRGLFSGVSFHIMFDDMPYVDRVLQLCLDIYLVRESGELHLEEDLFSKLIFLYRSPETLIKWTRFPQNRHRPRLEAPPMQH